jgi:hypothetical protein
MAIGRRWVLASLSLVSMVLLGAMVTGTPGVDVLPAGASGGPQAPAVDAHGPESGRLILEDCNENGVPDDQDILEGTSEDCNENGVPDECEIGDPPDHNCCETGHGAGCTDPVIEACVCAQDPYCCDGEWDGDCVLEVETFGCGSCAIENDCNLNDILDECEVPPFGEEPDCNTNLQPDSCDIDDGVSQDCQPNEIPDECDIASGDSNDCDGNGIPDECEAADVFGIRIMQESSAGAGDFSDNVLGLIAPYETTLDAAGYFRYDQGDASSFNGPEPVLVNERSHLFLVNATDGLSLFIVHDRPGNADGGGAFSRIEIQGDPDGAFRSVEDDPGEPYGGNPGDSVFTADHVWSACCTDGVAVTGIDGLTWSLTVELSDLAGMNSWAAYSPGTAPIDLVLQTGRRVKLQVIFEPAPADCNGNGIPDACDIAEGVSEDCNGNGTPDECDIVDGTSLDENPVNGVPDECETCLNPWTYTLNEHFDRGTLLNVNYDLLPDALSLDSETEPFPFVWVACSGRGTIVKIDTETGEILGEYWSAPNGRGRNPSRTTVDLTGNLWAGNRDEANDSRGSVIHIGLVMGGTRVDSNGTPVADGDYLAPPFEYNECIDHDGDGLIKTSRGLTDIRPWTNPGGIDNNGGVSSAEDECLIGYYRVDSNNVRHVSVDYNNNIWVGGQFGDETIFQLLDGDTGEALATFDVGVGGYGGLVDGQGILWSASRAPFGLLRYDPKGTIPTDDDTWDWLSSPNAYGLAVDTLGNIWHAQYTSNTIYKFYPDGTVYPGFPKGTGGASGDRGVAVTPIDNNVWVANSAGSDVSRLDPDGNVLKVIGVGNMPTGVAVDQHGKVWVTNHNSNSVMRIDPNAGGDGLGGVDLTVDLGAGATPYNYSDMTGQGLLAVVNQGSWTFVHEGLPNMQWDRLLWNEEPCVAEPEPAGTTLTVEIRAAEVLADLEGQSYVEVEHDVPFGAVTGRYLEVRVSFNGDETGFLSPVLCDLTVKGNWLSMPGVDCQPNGAPDVCDFEYGLSRDLNGNGVPDDCEPDCNNNGIPDDLDIADGTSEDCNFNSIPDECDLNDGTSLDCNEDQIPDECQLEGNDCNLNDVPDDCDIAEGMSFDCNADQVPDECQLDGNDCNFNDVPDDCDIDSGFSEDCQPNGTPDECDIEGDSDDVNGNLIPDECEVDCNGNGIPDDWDILQGTSQDCNGNTVPDECDISEGTSQDCNENGVPDECDIDGGAADDCNENGIPDQCELDNLSGQDCNRNGVLDSCDLEDGTSFDLDGNGVPDECDPQLGLISIDFNEGVDHNGNSDGELVFRGLGNFEVVLRDDDSNGSFGGDANNVHINNICYGNQKEGSDDLVLGAFNAADGNCNYHSSGIVAEFNQGVTLVRLDDTDDDSTEKTLFAFDENGTLIGQSEPGSQITFEIDITQTAGRLIHKVEFDTAPGTDGGSYDDTYFTIDNLYVEGPIVHRVLMITINGSYNSDGNSINQTLLQAGAATDYVVLSSNGQVANLLANNTYDQIWVYDLSTGGDNYPADYQAIADWFNSNPSRVILCDGRIISSYWQGRWQNEGRRLTQNYYENMRIRGGGILLGTDHSSFQGGINTINNLIGIAPFFGTFNLTKIPVDPGNPLMNTPNNMGVELWDDSSPGQTPYGLQPNGRILYTLAWHSGNQDTPGISATVQGEIGFRVDIVEPENGSSFVQGEPITFTAAPSQGDPPFTYSWQSNLDGELGEGESLVIDTLSPGIHAITVLAEDGESRDDDDSITVTVVERPDLSVTACGGPGQADAGAMIDVSWTVTNIGTLALSGSWTDAVFISPDDIIGNGNDTLLGTFGFDGTLEPEESYDRLESVTLPAQLAGEYWLIVVTDHGDAIEEPFAEDNNGLVCGNILVTDTMPPTTTITGGPANNAYLNATDVTYEWTGDDNGSLPEDLLFSYCVGTQGQACDPTVGPFNPFTTVTLEELTEADSPYTFSVVAQDEAGNIDGTPASRSFTVDLTEPELIAQDPEGLVNRAVCDVVVTFSEPVEGFGAADVVLTGPNGPIAISGVAELGGPDRYRVSFACQTTVGVYSFSVGPDIFDRAGNAMAFAYEGSFEILIADLGPVDLTIPAEGTAGGQITVEWTGINKGVYPAAGPWTDGIYLSSDDQWGNDQLLGEFTFGGVLDPEETYHRIQTVTLPGFIEGPYWIFVVIDKNNDLDEPNEGADNRLVSEAAIDIALRPYPDLVVTDIEVPDSAWSGQSVTICWTVTNLGDGPTTTPVWRDGLYMSFNDTIGGGDTYLGQWDNPSSLDPGESYEQCRTITIPESALGCYYFIVRTDRNNHVFEYRSNINAEANNDLPADDCTTVTLPPPADLIVTTVNGPFFSLSGEPITVTWEVMNDGTSPTSTGYWQDSIYISEDETLGAGDTRLCNIAHNGVLNPGESYMAEGTCTLPRWIEGNYYVFVRTDSQNHVPEQGLEGNNNGYDSSPMEVQLTPPPDLEVDTLTVTGSGASGGVITVSWTVTNFGGNPTEESTWHDSVYLSQDDDFGTPGDNVRLGGPYRHDGRLEPDESYSREVTVSLPHCIDGPYHVFVVCDVNDEVEEFYDEFENNNDDAFVQWDVERTEADLAISAVVAPNNSGSSQPIAVSWTVTNVGNATTGAVTIVDEVYLSADETFDPEADTKLGSRPFTGLLNPGDNYEVEDYVVVLPPGISGDYFVFVRTNSTDTVEECSVFGNNADYDVSGLFVEFTEADLIVDVVAAPASGSSGDVIEIDWTVTNVGNFNTNVGSWVDKVYLSEDQAVDPEDDFLLGTFDHFGPLAPGEGYEAVGQVTLPAQTSGAWYVVVCTDADEQVPEPQAEGNNCTASEAIAVTAIDPDLTVTLVTAPTAGESGDVIEITWEVENIGARATEETQWKDAVYISADELLDAEDLLLGIASHSGGLAIGETYTMSKNVTLAANTSGTFYILVKADYENDVFEGGLEDNNVNFDPAGITVTCIEPDLVALSIEAPAQADAGFPITVSWMIVNQGDRITPDGGWTDALYLSDDPVLDPQSDTLLGEFSWNNTLDVDESYTREATVDLPNGLSGAHYLFVQTDTENDVLECGSSENNISNPPALVSLGLTEVDLRVASIAAPVEGYAGQEVAIEWSVLNAGSSATPEGNWQDSVYLSQDTFLDPGVDPALGYLTRTEPLAAGVSYDTGGTFNIPAGTPPGDYYVLVVTDSSDAVYEHEAENNNLGDSGTQSPIYEPLTADLVVTDIVIPLTASPGLSATFNWTVENQGANPAVGSWYDSIYLSTDTEWDLGDAFVARVRHVGTINPGNAYNGSFTGRVPGVLPEPHYVIVRCDINNHIPEDVGEDNNITASADQVDMLITQLTLGVPFDAEQTGSGFAHYYQVEVEADETLLVTLDADYPVGSNELYIKYGSIPLRGTDFDDAHENPFLPDQQVTIPTTQTGTYYILVFGDYVPNPPKTYTILAESVPFGITELDPAEGSNTASVTIEITGARFTEDTVFSLIDQSQAEVFPTVVYPFNSATAYATFDLRGSQAGLADAHAETPDGAEDTEIEVFEILPGGNAQLGGQIIAPSSVRAGRAFSVRVGYGNVGVADMPAPLLELRASRTLYVATHPDGPYHPTPVRILGVNPEGPAGILTPGSQNTIPLYVQGTGSGALRMGLVRLSARAQIDWAEEGERYRPPNVEDAQWNAVWGRLQARIGDSYGALEQELANLATRLWGGGELVWDVFDLMEEELDLAYEFYPSWVSGNVIEGETELPLAGATIWARSNDGGVLVTTVTDEDGNYEFRLPSATYELQIEGYLFNPSVSFLLPPDKDIRNLTLYAWPIPDQDAVPLPTPVEIPEQEPSIVRDATGNVQMVWNRGSEIWHGTFDGSEWKVSGAIPDVEGADPQIDRGLVAEGPEAVTVAWQQESGNAAKLFYAGGRPAEGEEGYAWSTPVAVTNDMYADQYPILRVLEDGRAMLVWLKKDADITDDTDLYYTTEGLALLSYPAKRASLDGGGSFGDAWSGAEILQATNNGFAPPDIELSTPENFDSAECIQISWRKVTAVNAPYPVGGDYGLGFSVQYCGTIGDCSWTGAATVQGDAYFGPLSGNLAGSGSAKWTVDKEPCDWMFNEASVSIQSSASAKIPMGPIIIPLGPFGAITIPGSTWGVIITDGLGASLAWTGPNFSIWPSSGNVSITIGGGLFGEIDWGEFWGWSVKIEASGVITITLIISIPLDVDLQGCFTMQFQAQAGPFSATYTRQWCASTQLATLEPEYPEGAYVIVNRTPTPDGGEWVEEIIVTVDPLEGTGAVYPGSTVLADVTGDLRNDGPASLVELGASTVLAAWTKDSTDPSTALGSSVVVAEFDGSSWSAPVEVADAADFNFSPQIAIDVAGDPILVWSQASGEGVSIDDDAETIYNASEATDIYYSRRVNDVWTTPTPLLELSGADKKVAMVANDTGLVLAAWVHTGEDGLDESIYSSFWDGATWSEPVITPSLVTGKVAVEFVHGTGMVVWSADGDGDVDTPNDQRIFYLTLSATDSSTPQQLPAGPNPFGGLRGDIATGETAFTLPPVPEECCWECEEDLDCVDGKACTEDKCVDHKCVHDELDWFCDDLDFCNGEETCAPDDPNAGSDGCIDGDEPCSDDEFCLELEEQCVECIDNSHCDDGIGCTEDLCVNHSCQHNAQDDVCDDGAYCNGTETCRPEYSGDASGCAEGTNPCPPDSQCSEGENGPICACENDADCNDAIACTEDACVNEECQNTPNDELCDDDLFCNGEEQCISPRNGQPWDGWGCISDGNPCPPDMVCDEDNDECRACQNDSECDDGNACTDDTCEPDGSCSHSANDDRCDDGNVCNGQETCDAEDGCQPGTPLDCGEGDECTNVWCDPDQGCQSESVDCNDGPDVIRPRDPNEKVAPEGYGPERWVSEDGELLYTVYFENVPEATAPAQLVTITDDLSADLDWRTFRVGDVGFGDVLVTVPENRSFFQHDVDLIDEVGLIVRIIVGIDIPTGQARWRFISLDPNTGEPTNDPESGFLPPNNPEVGDGEGFVTFRIRPLRDTVTGTVVPNGATIVFDTLEAIETNVVENTVDGDAPVTSVAPLPTESAIPFPLAWSGDDPVGGSGFAYYEIYASQDGGPYELYRTTADTAVDFTAPTGGTTWAFYSLGRDNAGNLEEAPLEPDAVTTVEAQVPEAPQIGLTTAVTVRILELGTGNADHVEHAVYEETSALYVGPDGRLQVDPYWQPLSAWLDTLVWALEPVTDYQFTAKARSAQGVETEFGLTALATTSIQGDVDGNRIVDGIDLDLLRQSLGATYGDDAFNPAADLDGDATVTFIDLGILRRALTSDR